MRFLVELSLYTILDMSNAAPQKRKRAYRHRVKCSECKKEIVAEYQDAHARTKHVGNIALINIERAYANSVLSNDMDHIIDIFGRRNGRDSSFF